MSAINWLPFISPFIWILLVLNGLAFFPLPKKNQKARRVKFTLVLFAIVLIGWALAIASVHIMTPIVRVNTLVLSKLLLVPSLFLLGGVLIMRLHQGKNFLTIGLCRLGCFLKPFGHVLAYVGFGILYCLSGVFSETPQERRRRERKAREPKGLPMNWRGDYIGQSKRHKY